MTIARIVAIAVVVCAATGMTTQAEAAKRKAAGPTTLEGCPYWVPVCGIVMGSGSNTYVLSGALGHVGSVIHPGYGTRPEDRQ
ncbi:MAG: hypothetical protein WB803_14270 [Pseudolabrys sp.]